MGLVPRLEKVISSKISLEDFQLLEELARQYFLENKIKQPTISHIVRAMIHSWVTRWDRQRKWIRQNIPLTIRQITKFVEGTACLPI